MTSMLPPDNESVLGVSFPESWWQERPELELLTRDGAIVHQDEEDVSPWLPAWAHGALDYASEEPVFSSIRLLREQTIFALYAVDLLCWVQNRSGDRTSSQRRVWQQLQEHGARFPAWAWSLVGIDDNLAPLRHGELLRSGGHVGAVEGWLLAEASSQHGPLPIDDSEWLRGVLGPVFSDAHADARHLSLCLQFGDDGHVIETKFCPTSIDDAEADTLEVKLHEEVFAAASDPFLTRDWCLCMRSSLSLALRPVLQEATGLSRRVSGRPASKRVETIPKVPWSVLPWVCG